MAKEKKQSKMNMQAIMEVYKKLATPGKPHKVLARLAGTWSIKIKYWTEPNTPPRQSSGTAKQKMVLGGRFLRQELTSRMMGCAFKGIGFTGYDNHTKKYATVWMDSMSTAIMFSEGTGSEDGKLVTQESRYDDPVKGPMKWRSVTKIVDKNTIVFEMYGTDKRGKEEKMMEITYTRKQ